MGTRDIDERNANPVWAFAVLILHGDEAHRAWLLAAAEAFINGREIPRQEDRA